MHFRRLQFDDVEDVLASDPELPSALGRIVIISNLILSEIGPLARAMLDGMTTNVYHISIDFPDDPYKDPEDSNALVALKSLRLSLMSISGRWLETTPELPFYDIKYPHVHALTMDTFDVVHIAHYAYSCPHATSLTLESIASMDSIVQAEMRLRCTEWREENRRAQREHAQWEALEDYQGSVVDLWALGLMCHVERLEFTRDGWDSAMFKDVLQDVRPIAIRMAVGVRVMSDPMFVDALHQSSARDLRLEIIFDEADRDKDVSVTLDTLVEFVSAAQLRFLSILIDCRGLHGRTDSPESIAEGFINGLDVEALANRVQENIPSLKGLFIHLHELRDRPDVIAHRGTGE